MEGVGKCVGCGGGKGKCVGGVGKYGEEWGMGSRCVEVCSGCGKICLGSGEGCGKGVGVGQRVLGWCCKRGGADAGKCGTIQGSGEMWGEGWCHDLGPKLS